MRFAILLVLLACTLASGQEVPADDVVPLQSTSLMKAPDEAHKVEAGSFWIAYRVEVKPNIAIDTHEINVPWDATIHGPDVSVNVSPSTTSLGIFVRYDQSREVEIQVLNLHRKHDFRSAPVFWLGQRADRESLHFLQTLLETHNDLGVGLVRAIGIHRDSSSAEILKANVRLSGLSTRALDEALCWIGQSRGQSSFLYNVAIDGSLPLAQRSSAVLALLESPDPAAGPVLIQLRSETKERHIQNLIDRYNRGGKNSPLQTSGPKT